MYNFFHLLITLEGVPYKEHCPFKRLCNEMAYSIFCMYSAY